MNRPRDHVHFISLLTVLVAVLLGAVRVDAQSVLNFPRVLSSETVFTGVAIGNPTSGEATVTLTAYGADGTLAEGGENPTTVTIAAGGQLARQHRELFGDGEFNGWVQATSGTAGLTGFFLNANPALTDLDGALAGESGGELILPFIAGMAPSLTEVTVVNPGQETATVTLEVFGVDGVSLGTATLELEAKALVRDQPAHNRRNPGGRHDPQQRCRGRRQRQPGIGRAVLRTEPDLGSRRIPLCDRRGQPNHPADRQVDR